MRYLYIPGLGDHYDPLRRLGLRRWRRYGMSVTLVPMRWSDRSESYQTKRARVEAALAAVPDGQKITLIGESAGGAVALAVFHAHADRISRLVTICGKNHGADTLWQGYRRRKPAFVAAVERADATLPMLSPAETARIVTVYSTGDRVVRPKDTRIHGAKAVELHSRGHLRTIAGVILRPSRAGLQKIE